MNRPPQMVPDVDTSEMDRFLLPDGRVILTDAPVWRLVDPLMLRVWCHKQARYGIPTRELVDWLKIMINGREAIEVGSGNGDLGYHVGICETDNYCQVDAPQIREAMRRMGQPVVRPKPSVKKLDAVEAVAKYRPRVVVAMWVTQFGGPSTPQSCPVGVKEREIIDRVDQYILIGNEGTHGKKKIMDLPHETFSFPWLVSRAADQSKNRVWVWKGNHANTQQ